MTTTPTPWILAAPASLDPKRYRHARELVDQATYDLDRIDPPDDDHPSSLTVDAHIARAALDKLAENTQGHPQPPDWAFIAHTLGLTIKQARRLVTNHLDPDDYPSGGHPDDQ